MSKDQAKNLKPILKENKLVAKNVEILQLHQSYSPKGNSWISWVPVVFAPLMVNLLELTLHGDIFTNAHPRLLFAVTAFKSIRKLSLYDVKLSRFGHLADLIHAFPRLRHLALYDISWNPDPAHLQLLANSSQHSITRRQIQITHLDSGGYYSQARQIYQWLSAVETVKNLRTYFGWYDPFDDLMEYEPSHLRSVCLCDSHDRFIHVPTNGLNSLQTLNIFFYLDDLPIKILTSILASSPRALRKIAIYLEDPRQSLDDSQEQLKLYGELDDVLFSHPLKELKVLVCLYGDKASDEVRDWWQQSLFSKLPKFCTSEDKLTVSWISTLVDPQLRWEEHRDGFYTMEE